MSEDPLVILLEGVDGKVHAKAEIEVNSSEWIKYEAMLTARETDYSSRLVLITKGSGKLYLDMVSLFPKETFKKSI